MVSLTLSHFYLFRAEKTEVLSEDLLQVNCAHCVILKGVNNLIMMDVFYHGGNQKLQFLSCELEICPKYAANALY